MEFPSDEFACGAEAAEPRPRSLQELADFLGYRYIPDVPATLPASLIESIDGQTARECGAVPLCREGMTVVFGLVDPSDSTRLDRLSFAVHGAAEFAVAEPDRLQWLLDRHYGGDVGRGDPAAMADAVMPANDIAIDSPADDSNEAGDFVDFLLAKGARERASDIHLEPGNGEFRIRLRIDGLLREIPPPPMHAASTIISRLKVLANLDIAERRLPQDGRIVLQVDSRPVEFRVSTLPAQFGESVVLRVLDQASAQRSFPDLGMSASVERALRAAIAKPSGIIIVTGPTGSGKTTTLYACLRELNQPHAKLLTVEDPVEYEIDGVMQASVNAAAGLDFPTALRAFLRNDPDIVMVGEIRDAETARIAIQAALTGHLVLTTLHTNDAIGAVTRLGDLGIEPYLIASTVEAVVAQRLLRRLCPACSGKSCSQCHDGYAGRVSLFEVVQFTDGLREAIVAGQPLAHLRSITAADGTVPLQMAAERAVAERLTTIQEVQRHISA